MFRIASRLVMRPLHRQMRGMTLGARTAAIDAQGRVLLVRHGYAPGWILPGGGVERGETVFAAALRELREETGIVAEEEPRLHGFFCNHERFPGDHIACFVLRQFTRQPFKPSAEIAAAEFFAADRLPADTTAGTRRRIEEILSGRPVAHHW
ncbi:MAG: NUDIX domain-containing protein [Hyphomicrobiales bacterium]